MKEKRIFYKSDNITVSYSPDICIHAAECVNGLPEVFDINRKPWINPNSANPEKIKEVINKCPSGALKYHIKEEEDKMEEKQKTKITVMPNGPVMVEGNLDIIKMSGEEIKQAEKVFLCRCGFSENKPFCDGSHKKNNFEAE